MFIAPIPFNTPDSKGNRPDFILTREDVRYLDLTFSKNISKKDAEGTFPFTRLINQGVDAVRLAYNARMGNNSPPLAGGKKADSDISVSGRGESPMPSSIDVVGDTATLNDVTFTLRGQTSAPGFLHPTANNTIGQVNGVFAGKLFVTVVYDKNGIETDSWRFEGTFAIDEDYNFEPHSNGDRRAVGEAKTTVGRILVPDKGFKVINKPIQVTFSSEDAADTTLFHLTYKE